MPVEFSKSRLYVHGLWNDHLLILLFPVVLYLAASFFVPRFSICGEAEEPFYPAFSFFSGFYTLVVLNDLLVFPYLNDIYLLFLLPVLRISTMISVTLSFTCFSKLFGFKRYILLFFSAATVFAVPAATMFYRINYISLAILTCVIILAWAVLALVFFRDE